MLKNVIQNDQDFADHDITMLVDKHVQVENSIPNDSLS